MLDNWRSPPQPPHALLQSEMPLPRLCATPGEETPVMTKAESSSSPAGEQLREGWVGLKCIFFKKSMTTTKCRNWGTPEVCQLRFMSITRAKGQNESLRGYTCLPKLPFLCVGHRRRDESMRMIKKQHKLPRLMEHPMRSTGCPIVLSTNRSPQPFGAQRRTPWRRQREEIRQQK